MTNTLTVIVRHCLMRASKRNVWPFIDASERILSQACPESQLNKPATVRQQHIRQSTCDISCFVWTRVICVRQPWTVCSRHWGIQPGGKGALFSGQFCKFDRMSGSVMKCPSTYYRFTFHFQFKTQNYYSIIMNRIRYPERNQHLGRTEVLTNRHKMAALCEPASAK